MITTNYTAQWLTIKYFRRLYSFGTALVDKRDIEFYR